MKTLLSVLSLSLVTSLQAQVQTPGFPTQANGLPASPLSSGLPASPVNVGLPGFNNSFGPLLSNQLSSTALSGGSLNTALLNLQAALVNAWPLVASFNNNFDFSAVATNAGAGTTSVLNAGTATGTSGDLSTLLSGNASTGLGTSLGQDLSTIIGRPTALSPSGTALGTAPSLAATGVTNSLGLQPRFSGTNALAFSTQRDLLRAMLLLQDDIDRLLPLVNALNGGTLGTLPLAVPTNTTSGTVPNPSAATVPTTTLPQPRTLSPTGR
jgi:hypothetical protein